MIRLDTNRRSRASERSNHTCLVARDIMRITQPGKAESTKQLPSLFAKDWFGYYRIQQNVLLKKKYANWPLGHAATRSTVGAGVFKSRAGQIESDTVLPLPTTRHRRDISSKGTVLCRHNDANMGPADSLQASA